MPVNGRYFGWEDFTLFMPIGPVIDLIEFTTSVEREIEQVYGQGSAPRGEGRGNVKLTWKASMRREQWNLFLAYCVAAGKTPFTLAPFTMSRLSLNDDQGMSNNQLLQCRISKYDDKLAQNDKTDDVSIEGTMRDVEMNGVSMVAGLNLI